MELPTASASCKLFVGGLSAQTTTEMLRGHFAKYGRIVDVVVMSKQGRPRGFGFVSFEKASAAAMALSEPQWLGDRYVDVKRAVPGQQTEERATNKVFVGGLPPDAKTEDLRACFAQYGPIADAVVIVDQHSRRSRGFGFIRFASGVLGAHAVEAVLLNAANHWLGGKWIEVKVATPAAMLKEDSPSSCATSLSGTPTQQQLLKQDRVLPAWLCGDVPSNISSSSPQHQDSRRWRSPLSECGSKSNCFGMHSPHWSAASFTGTSDGFGLGWEDAAGSSPVFSQVHHLTGNLSDLNPAMLASTPPAKKLAYVRSELSSRSGTDSTRCTVVSEGSLS